MKTSNNLRGKRVVVVTHVYTTGPAHMLERYLIKKEARTAFIGHPFHFAPDARSHYRITERKKRISERFFPYYTHWEIINVFKDIVLTLLWTAQNGKADIYVGVDGVNAVAGLILRAVGVVKKVVYYTIDFVPVRYNVALLNKLYLWLDKTAVIHSDSVWNLSSKMTSEREKYGLSPVYRSKQVVVPMGTEGNVSPVPFAEIKRNHIAHMGHLVSKHGIRLLLQSLPSIRKKIPKAHIDILGGGEEEAALKTFVKDHSLSDAVTFHGYIKSHDELLTKLSHCALGVAPYEDREDSYIRNSDPGKVKAYLDAGLPVVVTKVPEVWKELEKYNAGIGISYTEKSLSDAIIWLLEDSKRLEKYRLAARALATKYNWENIYTGAFNTIDLQA